MILVIVAVGLVGFFYMVGSAKRHRFGRTALGFLVTVGVIGALWRRRADVARTMVAGGAIVGVIALVAAVWLAPGLRWEIILPTVGIGLVILFMPGGLLEEVFSDRRPSEMLADWIEGTHVRRNVREVANRAAPGAAVAKPKRTAPGQWSVPIHLNGDPMALDPHALGGAINRTGADARSVAVVPGSRLGTGTILVSDRPAPTPTTLWEALERIGPRPWPGPVSRSHDAPMAFGFDVNTRPIRLRPPGIDGGNVLVAGTSGSGKSTLLHAIIADLCFRPDVALILLDPDGVEHGLYRDRATLLAQGVDECAAAIERLEDEIMAPRLRRVGADDRRFWRVGHDGPLVVVVIDEYAAIPRNLKDGMTQWLARSRKAGGGSLIGTQRPEREVIPLIQRDNCQVRIALSLMSQQALGMTLGDDAYEYAPDILKCPLKGGFVARLVELDGGSGGGFWRGRSYLLTPPAVEHGDPVGTAARLVARKTAHLRIPWSALS